MLGAARALGVNQSTAQRRLAELEKSLGCRLIIRHLTGYRLTELGEGLVHSAESVEQAVAAFERDLAARDEALSGTVRPWSAARSRMRPGRVSQASHTSIVMARRNASRTSSIISWSPATARSRIIRPRDGFVR
jgi:hypothetical protein